MNSILTFTWCKHGNGLLTCLDNHDSRVIRVWFRVFNIKLLGYPYKSLMKASSTFCTSREAEKDLIFFVTWNNIGGYVPRGFPKVSSMKQVFLEKCGVLGAKFGIFAS